MPARLYLDAALQSGATLTLPAGPARHAQVLRMQPGESVTLFNGQGGEWSATIVQMGRSDVRVLIGAHEPVERELPWAVTLALGVPANERMDALVEKATELGVQRIQPLICERSVWRLAGERADKKVQHWQAVAQAACEQCGRTRVPVVAPVRALTDWLQHTAGEPALRWVLSLRGSTPLADAAPADRALVCLSGPEGGWTDAEESAARAGGFLAVSLGPRVLRADTAPLAVLAHLAVSATRAPH